jgi:phosphoglycerate dehydrogenase-like enzyme
MVIQSKIMVLGRMAEACLMEDTAKALQDLGHHVSRYEDPATFHRETGRLVEADALIAAPRFPCSRELMASAPRLRGIISPVTGVEGVDVRAATDLGIVVANGQTPENSESLAEATILLILAALYDLHGSEAVLRQNLARPVQMTARMLRDKKVGMIGFGQIARAMAARLIGWNVKIFACARRVHDDAPGNVTWVAIDELLASCDVVCVLASLNQETRGLLNADRLRLHKHGAILVNTARGGIIDEAALLEITRQRPDLRLALDTFIVEPLPPDSPLRDLPNAILTPHMVGHTQESVAAIPGTAVENVRRVLSGEPPLYICNPEVMVRWRSRWVATTPTA